MNVKEPPVDRSFAPVGARGAAQLDGPDPTELVPDRPAAMTPLAVPAPPAARPPTSPHSLPAPVPAHDGVPHPSAVVAVVGALIGLVALANVRWALLLAPLGLGGFGGVVGVAAERSRA